MERRDDLCSFSDCGSDTLVGAGPHVLDGEDPGPTRFQRLAFGGHLSAGQYETLGIQVDARPG